MAFTRKWLSALGIEADKIDEIIAEHIEVVDGLKKTRDDLQSSLDKATEDNKKLVSENETLKKGNGDNYDKLKKEFDDYKAEVQNKEAHTSKVQAYTELLRQTGVSEKRIPSIIKVTEVDKIELDNDGKIKDEKNYTESIKSEWSEFIETRHVQGANTTTPPVNTGGNVAKTKAEILEIKDATERQKAWLEYLNNKGDK